MTFYSDLNHFVYMPTTISLMTVQFAESTRRRNERLPVTTLNHTDRKVRNMILGLSKTSRATLG